MAQKPDHYDGSDIQVLEGLEAVRNMKNGDVMSEVTIEEA